MIDVTAATEATERLPAVYSQGFAVVRVIALADPYSTGPLAVPEPQASADNDVGEVAFIDDDFALLPVA